MRTKKWKKQLLAGITAIGMIFGMVLGIGMPDTVQAAETPVITDLRVTVSEDGTQLIAQCDYQNYDAQSGCVMTLYLYRMATNGEAFIAAYKRIPYAGEGRGTAVADSVTDGIYLASVGMDYGGRVVQINSEHYYRVTQSGNKVEVTEVTDTEEEGRSDQDRQEKEDTCIHDLAYEIIRPATVENDALMAVQCTVCGAVLDEMEVPNSAYATFQKETIAAIRNAQTKEVIIVTKRWISFHQSVLEAISKRPDVTVIIWYQYQGEMHEVTIPAGTDVRPLADENGFCGFLYLNQIFDETSL